MYDIVPYVSKDWGSNNIPIAYFESYTPKIKSKNIYVRKCLFCGKLFPVFYASVLVRYCSQTCAKQDVCHGYDQTFLDNPNELSAYFLGLWVTDGSMPKGSKTLCIASTDKQLIDALVKATFYTNCITENHHTEKNWKILYVLNYAGKIKKRIEEFGYKQGSKTGKEFIPSFITDDVFHHFLRGVIDGDGTIHLLRSNRIAISIAKSSRSFLKSIWDKLIELGIVKGGGLCLKFKCACYSLYFGPKDSVAIGNFIYKDATIKLERKYNNYIARKDVAFRPPAGTVKCSVDSCNGVLWAKGYCHYHYNYFYQKEYRKCEKSKAYSKKYQRDYYMKYKKYGKTIGSMQCTQ